MLAAGGDMVSGTCARTTTSLRPSIQVRVVSLCPQCGWRGMPKMHSERGARENLYPLRGKCGRELSDLTESITMNPPGTYEEH